MFLHYVEYCFISNQINYCLGFWVQIYHSKFRQYLLTRPPRREDLIHTPCIAGVLLTFWVLTTFAILAIWVLVDDEHLKPLTPSHQLHILAVRTFCLWNSITRSKKWLLQVRREQGESRQTEWRTNSRSAVARWNVNIFYTTHPSPN